MNDTHVPGYPEAGDPRRHGYALCPRCHTWRRPESYGPDGACLDVVWCGRQAGVGAGTLDADTGQESTRAKASRPNFDAPAQPEAKDT